ncbi:MAG: hypothetical protein NEHIOOID_00736 [Holosporales bacterium]
MSGMLIDIKKAVRKNLKNHIQILEGEKPAKCFFEDINEAFEKILIEEMLNLVDNNQKKAAEYLGIHRNTLSKKIRTFEIKVD